MNSFYVSGKRKCNGKLVYIMKRTRFLLLLLVRYIADIENSRIPTYYGLNISDLLNEQQPPFILLHHA